jgi:hypothetical protein
VSNLYATTSSTKLTKIAANALDVHITMSTENGEYIGALPVAITLLKKIPFPYHHHAAPIIAAVARITLDQTLYFLQIYRDHLLRWHVSQITGVERHLSYIERNEMIWPMGMWM